MLISSSHRHDSCFDSMFTTREKVHIVGLGSNTLGTRFGDVGAIFAVNPNRVWEKRRNFLICFLGSWVSLVVIFLKLDIDSCIFFGMTFWFCRVRHICVTFFDRLSCSESAKSRVFV